MSPRLTWECGRAGNQDIWTTREGNLWWRVVRMGTVEPLYALERYEQGTLARIIPNFRSPEEAQAWAERYRPEPFTWRQTDRWFIWEAVDPSNVRVWRATSEGSSYTLERYVNGYYRWQREGFESLLAAQTWAENFEQGLAPKPAPEPKKPRKSVWERLLEEPQEPEVKLEYTPEEEARALDRWAKMIPAFFRGKPQTAWAHIKKDDEP